MSRALLAFVAAWAFALAIATDARADDGPPSAKRAASPKRKVPDYEGRRPKPTSAGDVFLWVPRVLLSPLYLTTEYVLRRPLAAFFGWLESNNLLPVGSGPSTAGFAPIAYYDFGFNPAFGVYLFWDNAGTAGNDLSFRGTTWGADWLAGVLTNRVRLDRKTTFTFDTAVVHRTDYTFFGVGSNTLEQNLGRFGDTKIDVSGSLDMKPTSAIDLRAGGGVRSVDFQNGYYGSDRSLEAVSQAGAYVIPDGFARGYTSAYEHVSVALDSRPSPRRGSGVRFEIAGENAADLRARSGWVHYGTTLSGYWDITETGRVVMLSLATAFADPLGKDPIPFTELNALGGSGLMRGYTAGRLLGRSYAVATVRYEWPIWSGATGVMQVAVGNVFDAHLEGFKPSLLRLSGAIGVESSFSVTSPIEILVGCGSETFDQGATITSARVLIGTSLGF